METLNSGSDRISELPEALLLHILSFLSTIHAVQTSILSRRWRYLWPNVQNLEFDQREFSTEYAITEDIHPSSTIRFVNFVHWVLFRRNHDSNVGRFQLWWKFSFNMNFASIWVEYALSHSVRELILYLTPNNFDELPRNIFTCQSLEECRLETPYLVQFLPDSVGFSKLRSLSLEGIIRGDLDGLISNCPVLEDLSLALETGNLNIYAPNLKWLSLSCNGISKPGKVHISTPSLVSFSYDSVGLVQCSLVHAPSLHEAYISIRQDRDGNSGNVTQIIGSLCNVVVLTLKKSTIELLSKVPDLSKCVLPFHNLEYLELRSEETFLTKAIQVIAILLEKCPNLVTLIIRKTFEKGEYQSDMFELEDEWTPQKMQYRCDLHHLYEIEIHGFDGGKDELEFIYFLLEKASALEKVDLICNEGSPHLAMQIKAWQKIHTLPRASSVAKIVLHQNLVVL